MDIQVYIVPFITVVNEAVLSYSDECAASSAKM